MKKVVLSFAILAMIISCKETKKEENKELSNSTEKVEQVEAHTDASLVEIDLKGTKLKVSPNGLEQQLVNFLTSGSYEKANDKELKDKWYDLNDVNFLMGSSSELEKGSETQLMNLVTILKAFPEAKIKIGGYTDKTGNEDNNKKISQSRADFIKAELEKAGVGTQVVSAEGYGSEFAKVAADASDEERASDRKMSIRFTK